jgi:hypothetical protein
MSYLKKGDIVVIKEDLIRLIERLNSNYISWKSACDTLIKNIGIGMISDTLSWLADCDLHAEYRVSKVEPYDGNHIIQVVPVKPGVRHRGEWWFRLDIMELPIPSFERELEYMPIG